LQDSRMDKGDPPRSSVRTYPVQYASEWQLKNGTRVMIRPIRPEDESAMARFHETLSDRSVYLRFFHMEKLSSRVEHKRLMLRCLVDYDREMALVAERVNPANAEPEIIAVGRLTRLAGRQEAEMALLVSDAFQHSGLGSEMLGRLIQVGHDEKLEQITATVLPENMPMRTLAARHGFQIVKDADLTALRIVLKL